MKWPEDFIGKVIQGDYLEVMREMPDGCINLILTDPPYGITKCKWDSRINLPHFWDAAQRVCNGPILSFAQTPFDKVLGVSNIKNLRYEWIWEKSAATGHLNAKKSPMKAHENILVFYSKQHNYYPIMSHGHIRKTATRRRLSELYGHQSSTSYDSTDRYPRSVLRFSSDKQKNHLHPTQKPLALMEYLLRTYTQPDDIVLDCFSGSGTTAAAAVRLGLSFVAVEKEGKQCVSSRKRIAAEQAQGKLFCVQMPSGR